MNQDADQVMDIVPRVETTSVSGTAASLIQMIERVALTPEIDIDRMDKLLTFLERIKASEAEAAFTGDFAAMQPDLPSIDANGSIVHNNKLIAAYAKWEDINDIIKPVLTKHRFVLSFASEQDEKGLTITAILKHSAGHKETATLRLPLDTSGAKNAVQAIGSTVSYGKRYSAGLVLNLTSRAPTDADDDGKRAGNGESVTDEQAAEIRKALKDADADEAAFLAWMKAESVESIPAAHFKRAMHGLNQRKAKVPA